MITVKTLRKLLKGLPDHMDVAIRQSEADEYPVTFVEKAKVETVKMMGEKQVPKIHVFVLTDEC